MIPTLRLYLIWVMGMAIARFLNRFFDRRISLSLTFEFDRVVWQWTERLGHCCWRQDHEESVFPTPHRQIMSECQIKKSG